MAYYTSFGDLQQTLSDYFRQTGKRMQFGEAVDALEAEGKLMEAPFSPEVNGGEVHRMGLEEFSGVVDRICFPVQPRQAMTERVNEDDIIPLLRDIFVIRHPRYTRPYPHRHDYVELDYVAQGSCVFHFEGAKRTMGAGELCVISPGSRHDIEITDESTVYCIMLRRSTFESSFFSLLLRNDVLSLFFRTTLAEQAHPNYLIFRSEELPTLQAILQNAMVECHATDEYSNICCISLINILLATLLRSASQTPQLHRYEGGKDYSPVLSYIQQNYRALTLTELAETFHYSKPYLCTLIKQNTGLSFTELIRRIRMSRSVEYLLNTTRSVAEIAEIVGYHSADHFSRVFRGHYGVSPQEYRKQNAEKSDRFIPFEMK